MSEDNDEDTDDDTCQSDGTANHNAQSLILQETVRTLCWGSWRNQELLFFYFLNTKQELLFFHFLNTKQELHFFVQNKLTLYSIWNKNMRDNWYGHICHLCDTGELKKRWVKSIIMDDSAWQLILLLKIYKSLAIHITFLITVL